jgi:hypothetical protein
VGNDSASAAQSKCEGTGVELGSIGLEEGSTRDGGHETAAAAGPDVLAVVEDGGDGETTRLRLSWLELGQMGGEQGARGERGASLGVDGIVGDAAVPSGTGGVGDDGATVVDSGYTTGVWGASRGEQGGVVHFLDRRWEQWGRQSRSIECTTRSGERVRTTSRNGVSWAVDVLCASLAAWWRVSCARGAVWVPDTALVAVSRVVAVAVVAIVDCDMAAEQWGSGLEMWGWGRGWGVVGRFGRVCRRFRGAGGSFEAGEAVLVVVVGGVVDVDGGCAGIDSGDVAGLVGSLGGEGVGGVGSGPSLVCTAVSQVLPSSIDVPTSFSRRGGSSLSAVCVMVLTVVVGVVWVVESAVLLVVVWVLESTRVAVSASLSISVSVLPTSRPSSNPSSYPSRRAALSRLTTSSAV